METSTTKIARLIQTHCFTFPLNQALNPSEPMAFPGFRSQSEPVKHVISLGCRCSQASVYRALGQRRYALPFDWIFTSPQMVTHCLQDDFQSFLDRQQLYQNGSSFDAIGLKPGSAPRERRLIGHKLYSTLTAGVGKGTIFNHRDPLHNDEDYLYTVRCVERFRLALASGERKLFVMFLSNQLGTIHFLATDQTI